MSEMCERLHVDNTHFHYDQHPDIFILCKKPKKRDYPTLHHCTHPGCNIRITSRNWRNRKPENQLELCDHHVRQFIRRRNIEQASDTILTLMRPVKYRNQGESISGITVQGYTQMLITVAKQKMGMSNGRKLVSFDPRYNRLEALETRHINLSQ